MLLDPVVIAKVKAATVAVGIVQKGESVPYSIVGSGFLFDSKGYIMTAAHVAEDCNKRLQKLNSKTARRFESAFFRVYKGGFDVTLIEKFTVFDLDVQPADYSGPLDFDVACGKPFVAGTTYPTLTIEQNKNPRVFDEILMCGYPGGEMSYSRLPNKTRGMRFSPIIQSGRIAALLPYDDVGLPDGIQTDIPGTNGSSGSPITDYNGNVISIAQHIIPAPVFQNNKPIKNSFSGVGIVYGIANNKFMTFINDTKEYYDTGISPPPTRVVLTSLGFKGKSNFTNLQHKN